MFTDLQIINLGLGKLSASVALQILPARTSTEKFVAAGYPLWKMTELSKRRWVFATEKQYPLTKSAVLVDPEDGKPYKYALPNECLRPIREKRTEWRQGGRFLYSAYDGLAISFVKNVDENEFDPLFVDVLASWIAVQCCEFVTQSTTKLREKTAEYREAVAVAGQANAFIRGPEDIQEDDNDFSFVTARYL